MTNPVHHRASVSGSRLQAICGALALMVVFLPVVAAAQFAQSKTYSVIYRFQEEGTGTGPSSLTEDAAGNLYGTTEGGGTYGHGTVFELSKTGKETVLHSFAGDPTDGANPGGTLIWDSAGNLYGTTSGGGTAGGFGTVFKMDKTGKETLLYSFTGGSDGAAPAAGLVMDRKGNLYGTTVGGGDLTCDNFGYYGCGTVFRLDTTGKETVLHGFTGPSADGVYPEGGLVRDSAGNLYGTTSVGGASNFGIVFKVTATGKETVLHSFAGYPTDGANPYAGLVRDSAGNLYGTTNQGGTSGVGTVFKLTAAGKETVLHSFVGYPTDGLYPDAGLVRDSGGNLYGTTDEGGSPGATCSAAAPCGTVFKLGRHSSGQWEVALLHSFKAGTDGAWPLNGNLILSADGNMYGVTFYGGGTGCSGFGCGTVFGLRP